VLFIVASFYCLLEKPAGTFKKRVSKYELTNFLQKVQTDFLKVCGGALIRRGCLFKRGRLIDSTVNFKNATSSIFAIKDADCKVIAASSSETLAECPIITDPKIANK
jgi:hypothetical protein